MLKRLIDILVSGAALLVLLFPFLIIMIILRLTGEGKVFYFQERVGLHGKRFNVIKFATMLQNSLNIGSGDITVRNDPRVLPMGKFLRKTKINELPQIFNVFKGDMSLVGWRPLVPQGFVEYSQEIQTTIVKVQPGLTGIGSVVFRDEEAIITTAQARGKDLRGCYREDIMPYKGALEIWYTQNKSLIVDFKIMSATALAILRPGKRFYLAWFKGLPEPKSPLIREYMNLPAL